MSYWASPVDVRGVSPVARWLLRRGTTQFKGQWLFPSVFQHTVRLSYEAPSFAARDGAMTTIFPAWLRLRLSYSLAGTAPHVVRASAILTPRPFLRSKNSQKTPHRYRIDTVLTSIRNRFDAVTDRNRAGAHEIVTLLVRGPSYVAAHAVTDHPLCWPRMGFIRVYRRGGRSYYGHRLFPCIDGCRSPPQVVARGLTPRVLKRPWPAHGEVLRGRGDHGRHRQDDREGSRLR